MRPALARHDEIMRRWIDEHGGYVVKMTGDGAHAAFATARRRRERRGRRTAGAARASRGRETGPLRVRMGLHTGVGRGARRRLLRHGSEPRGAADGGRARRPSRCARRRPPTWHATRWRQRLSWSISANTGSAISDARARVPGRRTRTYRVEFPPLRTLDAFPGNLPLQVTEFVGRDEELAELSKLLGHGAARDAHRHRRGGQDAAGAAGRGGGAAALPRRRMVRRPRGRRRRRPSWPARSRRRWACRSIGREAARRRSSARWRDASALARARQLRAPRRRGRAESSIWSCVAVPRHACSRPARRCSASTARRPFAVRPFAGDDAERALRRAGGGGPSRVRAHRRQRGGDRRAVPAARRHPARDRAGRRAGGVDEPGGDPRAHRRAVPAARARADAPHDGVTRPSGPRSTGRTACSTPRSSSCSTRLVGVRRRLHARSSRGRRRRRRRRRARRARPGRAVSWRSRWCSSTTHRGRPLPAPGDDARLRARTARRAWRPRPVAATARGPLPGVRRGRRTRISSVPTKASGSIVSKTSWRTCAPRSRSCATAATSRATFDWRRRWGASGTSSASSARALPG